MKSYNVTSNGKRECRGNSEKILQDYLCWNKKPKKGAKGGQMGNLAAKLPTGRENVQRLSKARNVTLINRE